MDRKMSGLNVGGHTNQEITHLTQNNVLIFITWKVLKYVKKTFTYIRAS